MYQRFTRNNLLFCSTSIRDITKAVAAAVIQEAIEEDLAEGYREMNTRELQRLNKVSSIIIVR